MSVPKESIRNLYKRGNVYWFSLQRDKKRTAVSLHTSDLAEAIRKASRLRHSPTIESGLLIAHCVERFVKDMEQKRILGDRNGWARRTADSKIYTLRKFANFCGHVSPDRVTADVIKDFYELRLRTRNAQTAYGNLMTVRSFFNWCMKSEKIVRENPATQLEISAPAAVGRKNFCTPELVAKLINECQREDLRYVLFCGFHAGLRALEIVESVPWWFDLKAGLLHLRKTETIKFKDLEERTIPMTGDFIRFVRDVYGLREPFMLHPENQHGKNRYRYDFTRPFREYMKEKKCEWVTPHIMRHTFASLLASLPADKGGPSIFQICAWMGIDVRTGQKHYAKLRPQPGALDAAFQVDKPFQRSKAESSSTRSKRVKRFP